MSPFPIFWGIFKNLYFPGTLELKSQILDLIKEFQEESLKDIIGFDTSMVKVTDKNEDLLIVPLDIENNIDESFLRQWHVKNEEFSKVYFFDFTIFL